MVNRMEFHDLKAQYHALKGEIDANIAEVISGGHFILGAQVDQLERQLAQFTGRKHCVACGNGTDALTLALMAWGIGPNDAVFTSDFTYFASASCASVLGATPVPVDIDESTFNIDPDALEAAILRVKAEGTLRPAVVIPVDLFGLPADYDRILPIAEKYGLHVLEDAAQGFGGDIRGKRAGSFGEISTTSFFPAKPLGCYGDGGAIFTDSDAIAELLRSLRANGRSSRDKYDNQRIGMNSRLDTMQAAILLPKLAALERSELTALNRAAKAYGKYLPAEIIKPTVPQGYFSSWAQYTIRLRDAKERDALRSFLSTCQIPSMVYYPRGLHQQSAFADLHLDDAWYPHTNAVTQQVLSLPMHPYLSDADLRLILEAINEFFSSRKEQ